MFLTDHLAAKHAQTEQCSTQKGDCEATIRNREFSIQARVATTGTGRKKNVLGQRIGFNSSNA